MDIHMGASPVEEAGHRNLCRPPNNLLMWLKRCMVGEELTEQGPAVIEMVEEPEPRGQVEMLASESSKASSSTHIKRKDFAATERQVSAASVERKKITYPAKSGFAAVTAYVVNGDATLTEESAYACLGFALSKPWKWTILSVIFFVQLSMNFNAAVYPNATKGMKEEFGIEKDWIMELGMGLFLICYAFGCELWAPWSEELGRFWILQASLFFVNVWQFMGIFGTSYCHIVIGRVLGGFSSAGGSVTLGIIADMFEADEHQFPTLFVVASSCYGSVLGPIFGSIIEVELYWRWVFIVQLIVGIVAQLAHALLVPETRTTTMLDQEAKRLRKQGFEVQGVNERKGTFRQRICFTHVAKIMYRPYEFLMFEPIVTFLSLLSGFSDALIFLGLYSFGEVLHDFHFTTLQIGLSFISLLVGYGLAYLTFVPFYLHDLAEMKAYGSYRGIEPERRLKALVYLVLLEPLGLGLFAAASLGPEYMHWIVVMIAVAMIGVANFAIYQASIDYMVASYGAHAASATGGNGFCRDLFAGAMAFAGKPLYNNFYHGTKYQHVVPTAILAGIGALLTIPVFVFYWHGAWFRERSKFAKELEDERSDKQHDRATAILESRHPTPAPSRAVSRAPSPTNSCGNSPDRSRKSSEDKSAGQSRDASPVNSPLSSRKCSVAVYKTRSRAATASSSNPPTPGSLSKQPSLRVTTKGLSKDGKLGSPRIVDEAGEEIELSPKTSERRGHSMAFPSFPSEDLSRARSNSEAVSGTEEVEEQMPSPLDAHFQNEQTLHGAFDTVVKRASRGQ